MKRRVRNVLDVKSTFQHIASNATPTPSNYRPVRFCSRTNCNNIQTG